MTRSLWLALLILTAIVNSLSLSCTNEYDNCASQEVDILLLSVKCTHSALILSFTKNTSKGEDVDLSPYQLYGVDFECFSLSNTSQLKLSDSWFKDPYYFNEEKKFTFNTNFSENVHCIFRGCLRTYDGFCMQLVRDKPECVIKDPSSQYSTSTVPGTYELLTVQLSSTPTSESYSSTTGPQIMASDQNNSTQYYSNQVSATSTSEHQSMIFKYSSVHTKLGEILSNSLSSLNAVVSSTQTKEETNQNTPTTSVSGNGDPRTQFTEIFIGVATILVIFVFCSIVLLTVSLKRRKRTALFKYNTKSTTEDEEASITIYKFDDISVSESIVTISQSLEITLPKQIPLVIHDATSSTLEDHSFTSHHQVEDIKEKAAEASVCFKDCGSEKTGPTQAVIISSETSIVRPLHIGSYQEKSSSLNKEETLSCTSSSTGGYVIATYEPETGNPLQSTVEPSEDKETFRLHSCSPTNDNIADSNLEFSYYNKEYLRSLSQGYVTDSERDDYIANPDEKEARTDFATHLSKGVKLQNAEVNDYVFQKKINNRLLFSAPQSSGYYSGCMSDCDSSYIPQETDKGYLAFGSDCEVDCYSGERVSEKGFMCDCPMFDNNSTSHSQLPIVNHHNDYYVKST